jgi:D-arabinonate dehydratase
MKVAALAQAHDLDIAPHGSQDIHVHLVAAIPNGLMLEYYRDSTDPLWAKMYRTMLSLNADGTVSAPDLPGIGIEMNQTVLDQYRTA